MVGFIITVIAVACLVSYKKVIVLGAEKNGGHEVSGQHQLLGLYILFFIIGAGVAAPQLATDHWGQISEQFPWKWRGLDKRERG